MVTQDAEFDHFLYFQDEELDKILRSDLTFLEELLDIQEVEARAFWKFQTNRDTAVANAIREGCFLNGGLLIDPRVRQQFQSSFQTLSKVTNGIVSDALSIWQQGLHGIRNNVDTFISFHNNSIDDYRMPQLIRPE